MQKDLNEGMITFNDIPKVMSDILKRFDFIDQYLDVLREEIRQLNKVNVSQHIPMNVQEACDFLKIKKSTMYNYIQTGQIPVNKKGKKYTFFKDDLIKWVESSCKTEVPLSSMEINEILSKRPSRRK